MHWGQTTPSSLLQIQLANRGWPRREPAATGGFGAQPAAWTTPSLVTNLVTDTDVMLTRLLAVIICSYHILYVTPVG